MLLISINWTVARSRYEKYVIKISVSPEKKGNWIFSNFFQGLKVFSNLFPCVYLFVFCSFLIGNVDG